MNIWNFIKEEIDNHHNVTIITVVERNGSSPGIVGFKMAVSETGAMNGSIGGGVMEYNMVELAKKKAINGEKCSFIKKQIHTPDAGKDKSGLMCSGEQTHAFSVLNHEDLTMINKIISKLDVGENGTFNQDYQGIHFDENNHVDTISYSYQNDENWKYEEQIGIKPTLYIFGAGHVSIPLSEIFRAIDFNVIVYDNRNELSTFEQNNHAHRKEIIDYKDAAKYVPDGENSYAVIMTVGHKSDELVLEKLINKNLKYLGMIGSKNKIKTIFDSLKSKGIAEQALAKVDSPIGLSINSKTTPEIAISIAAKVIQVKNC